jgi:hypothetical protein
MVAIDTHIILFEYIWFLAFICPSGNFATVDVASMIVGKAVSPENTDYSACVMPPPTKRYKLYAFFVLYGVWLL